MIAALWAAAHAATVNATLCVEFDVDFDQADDPGGSYNYAAGDYWWDNAVHQPARHLYVETADDVQGRITHQLDASGCADITVMNNGSAPVEFDVKIKNKAEINGVDILLKSMAHDTPWVSGSAMAVTFSNVDAVQNEEVTLVVDAIDGWQQMAIATYVLDRLDWRLDEPTDRDCCLEDAPYDLDGTCVSGSPSPYTRSVDPYLTSNPIIALKAITNQTGTCCGSKDVWTSGSPHRSMVRAGKNVQRRHSLSHELGHVMAGIRMGGWEESEYPGDAPADGCNGDWHNSASGVVLLPDSERGVYQKEYLAVGFREGWADFVAAWAWNASTNDEPEMMAHTWFDFDLDGDRDNYFSASGHPYDRVSKLGERPEIAQAVPSDDTEAWVNEFNWLEAALDEGACDAVGPPTTDCANAGEDADMESYNRSTIRDVSNMFWSLHHEDGIPADDLLQLYIDMCPRGWREDDGTCDEGDDLPFKRLMFAADALGEEVAVDDQWGIHVLH